MPVLTSLGWNLTLIHEYERSDMKDNKIMVGKPFMLEQRTFEILAAQDAFSSKPVKITEPFDRDSHVAAIKIHGPLSKHSSLFDQLFGMTSYDVIKKQLDQALADDKIAGILLDIDSPGGEVSGNFDLADSIYAARNKKPIWAVANEHAYSAAYAIASSAEKVFLSRTGGVGSVGVIANHIDQSGFDEKLGIKITTIFAGNHKNDFSPHEPLSSDARDLLQKEIDRLYEMFVGLVSRNRMLTEKQVRNTEAGLFYADEAVRIGFADAVASVPEVIEQMKTTINPRSIIMTKSETNPIDIDAIKQEAFAEGEASYRNQVLEIAAACTLAKMPEKLEGFIEQNMTVTQAKDVLMKALADKQTGAEITSHVVPVETKQQENPVVALAKAQVAPV